MTSGCDAWGAFLAADDLDLIANAGTELASVAADATARLVAVIDAWSDRQALANLLVTPSLIPPMRRADTLERALRGDDDYLALMAAAGAGQLDGEQLVEAERADVAAALLDLAASVDGIAARRAAASLGSVTTALDVPDLLVMLRHPDAAVRRNIVGALLPKLGTSTLAEVLADRDEVCEEDAAGAAEALSEDGIDLDTPAADLRVLPALDYLPNLADWGRLTV